MNSKSSKTVFILGAGASRAAGGPLMYNFIEHTTRVIQRREAGWASDYIEASLQARKKLQTAFIKSTVDIDNIENLFAIYEMASLIGRLDTLSASEVQDLPRNLRYLIMRTIEQSILYPLTGKDEVIQAPYPYEAFAELIINLHQDHKTAPVSIINFNYDLCFDYALHMRGWSPYYALQKSTQNRAWFKNRPFWVTRSRSIIPLMAGA